MSEKDSQLLKRIRLHLYTLYSKWASDGGGHHKSNEGWIGYSVSYPNWFEADNYMTDEPEIYEVQIYSYLFGTGRLHEYKNLEEAWEAVRTWKYELESTGV